MPSIPHEVTHRIGALQNQIWQTVSLTVSEAANMPLNFSTPLSVVTPISDLYAEMSAPKLVVQFAFASAPENTQVVLLPQDTFADLASAIQDEDITTVDDNLVADVRPAVEAIVQGICLAVGNAHNETIVASGLSVRFQIFTFPPNLQKSDECVRVNVAMSGDSFSGSAVWLMDYETAHAIAGVPLQEDDRANFGGFGDGSRSRATSGSQSIEDTGLDLLMDIPLEISVELGRVKMPIRDVVELGAGSIVEIEKVAGEPVDVLVNGRLVARGEVVVIEDNFGVRITEILNPADRLARLNEAA